MSRSPLRYSFEDLNHLKGKKVKLILDVPVKITGQSIESHVLVGYFNKIGTNANPPHYPSILYFVHESISEWPDIEIVDSQTTIIDIFKIESISLIE